jgi:hypothetical protein
MRAGVVMVGLALGCGPSDPPPAPHPLPTPAARAPRLATLTARWSELATVNGCFYFSGPDGRDDRLTGPVQVDRTGEAVTLTIGTATFTGTYKLGELYAERHSRHDFGGAWTVTETIHGRYLEGVMRARYHYAECARDQPCPGHCAIDATLAFVR